MNQQQTYGPVADQRFPGLTRDQINRIEQVTASYTGMDKLKIQQQLYQQAINQIKNQQVTEERFGAKNDMYCRSLDKDSKQKTTDQCSVRLEDLADIVKNKYNLNANTDTNTVINGVVKMAQDKNVDTNLLNKYLDSGDKEFLYEMGFEEKPEEDFVQKLAKGARTVSYFLNPLAGIAQDIGEYVGNHPAETTVGFAQSPGKWGYNLIGQWIDRAGKALSDKLQGTELANTIKQSAIDMFGEEEVKKFAEQRQQELANGTAFNGRDATDIRTPLLGDKANSEATQYGEAAGDLATAIALSYPMAAATAPYMGINTASQAGRTLLMGAGQGAADMAAYEYGSNQEIASPTELGVGALIGAGTPFVVPMASAVGKGISNKYNDIMGAFRTASKEKLGEELRNLFSRGVKPSSAGIKTTSAQEKIYDDAMDAVETIINNKNNLKFTNANGEEIVGKLPTNTREFAQAIQQTKKDIYNQYNAIAQAAGKDTRVNVDELVDELLKLKNDKAALLGNEGLETSIDNWLRGLSEVKDLSVEQAQKKIQEINQKLDAFYKNPNPNDVSKSSVDALVKNKLAESLDNSIESALGSSSEYDSLKRAYSSLKTIEKDVNHRAIVSGRQAPNSLVDSIADISSVESLLDVLSGSPVGAVKAIGKQALKKYIKGLNSSDNMVQKLFSKAEGELERSGTLKTNQQILRQQEREYQKWLSQGSNKNYLPFIEGTDDAGKTVIPGGNKIAVTPEGNAVREGHVNEVSNYEKSLENTKNSEYNYTDLNSNQLTDGYNGTNQGRDQGSMMDGGRNGGTMQETSMTNGGTAQGGAGTVGEPIAVENGEDMVNISKNLQSKADRGLFMDVHSAEDYNGYKNFSNGNKSAAISVKPDGDIINFVSTEKGAGKPLMLKAIEQGGNKMDNYGVGLTRYYENFGFEPVARVKFNREYAPEGWNFEKWGEPDIYVMKHNGDSIDAVKSNYGKYTHKTPKELDKLPEMDYDTALKYRDNLIELSNKSQKELRTSEDVLKYAQDNKDLIFDLYNAKHGKTVNPDDFREFVNNGGELHAGITHEAASGLADEYFEKLLAENKGGKGIVVAGGPGSGKGTSIGELSKKGEIDTEGAGIIVDKTKGNKELQKMIDNGMDVDYYVVVPDADNLVNNITGRASHGGPTGRTLAINEMGLPTHKKVIEIVKDLYKKKGEGANFNLKFIDNRGAKENINLKEGVEGLKMLEDYEIKLNQWDRESVTKAVDEWFNNGKITKAQRDNLIKSIAGITFVGSLLYGAGQKS